MVISIHALREEGDESPLDVLHYYPLFLSTPSARRATGRYRNVSAKAHFISIHALREEGDFHRRGWAAECDGFLSTPSARRATFS